MERSPFGLSPRGRMLWQIVIRNDLEEVESTIYNLTWQSMRGRLRLETPDSEIYLWLYIADSGYIKSKAGPLAGDKERFWDSFVIRVQCISAETTKAYTKSGGRNFRLPACPQDRGEDAFNHILDPVPAGKKAPGGVLGYHVFRPGSTTRFARNSQGSVMRTMSNIEILLKKFIRHTSHHRFG